VPFAKKKAEIRPLEPDAHKRRRNVRITMTDKSTKISVIGGGIMGIMGAYMLQQQCPDANITLYDESGFPNDNASFIAGGMISPYSELDHMPESYLNSGLSSVKIWQEISNVHNDCFEFANNGSLLIAHNADRHILERFKSILPNNDDQWQSINGQTITELEPQLNGDKFREGLYIKGEAHLYPKKAIPALLHNIKNKKVQHIDIKEEKNIANWVIDCRGMGAKNDATNLRGVKGETLIVRNPEFHLTHLLRLMHPRYPLYIVPRKDNIFLIGATIIETEENSNTSLRSGMELMSALYSIHPSFGEAQIIETKAGIRPSYPNNMPQIHVSENVISCNGLFRHGFLFSPIIANCAASIVTGQPYEFNHLFIKDNKENANNLKQQCA